MFVAVEKFGNLGLIWKKISMELSKIVLVANQSFQDGLTVGCAVNIIEIQPVFAHDTKQRRI